MAIGIVVVGLGPRGQDWLREVQRNPAYELTACVDIDRPTLDQAAGSYQSHPANASPSWVKLSTRTAATR